MELKVGNILKHVKYERNINKVLEAYRELLELKAYKNTNAFNLTKKTTIQDLTKLEETEVVEKLIKPLEMEE